MRRALLVGIDEYNQAPLSGCVHDAERMKIVLERHDDGSANFDCRILTSPPDVINRAVLRESVTELFSQKHI